MLKLEDIYCEVPLARQYYIQGNFEKSIEIYTKLLDNLNLDDETIPFLYIEYANVLIKCSNNYFINEISQIHNIDMEKRREAEEDLENAWNMLEVCRNSFSILKEYSMLGTTHFLLGEISLLNNCFSESIKDYVECINLYDMEKVDEIDYCDVYLSIANSYEFMEEYDMAIKYYKLFIELCDKYGLDQDEASDKIQEIKEKMRKLKKVEVCDDEVVDVNKCKKRRL